MRCHAEKTQYLIMKFQKFEDEIGFSIEFMYFAYVLHSLNE